MFPTTVDLEEETEKQKHSKDNAKSTSNLLEHQPTSLKDYEGKGQRL